MNIREHPRYFLKVGDEDHSIECFDDVIAKIESALAGSSGSIHLCADDGFRPKWQQFVFGAKIYIRSYFMIEWANNTCALIFHDHSDSEYRALSPSEPEDLSVHTRTKISFGEPEALDRKYCMTKEMSAKVVREFLELGVRPKWLEYEFVK
ncbi:hypothetical protein [uncultured Pseudoteredinibacter sp.]|uniref:hypothetical protein n=1 Tax=uncultured Pseudoteredinibacter sp. TaxID=1641701 RepID=UPI002619CDD0|nr:hypothetical protein [uncultured Pseudoteredinibacter sp.]